MSDILNEAVSILQSKLMGNGLEGSVKLDLTGLGAIRVEGETAEISDADADCTLTADPEVFQGMLQGEVNPTSAFMTGKLSVDGSMGVAMKLAGILA